MDENAVNTYFYGLLLVGLLYCVNDVVVIMNAFHEQDIQTDDDPAPPDITTDDAVADKPEPQDDQRHDQRVSDWSLVTQAFMSLSMSFLIWGIWYCSSRVCVHLWWWACARVSI